MAQNQLQRSQSNLRFNSFQEFFDKVFKEEDNEYGKDREGSLRAKKENERSERQDLVGNEFNGCKA